MSDITDNQSTTQEVQNTEAVHVVEEANTEPKVGELIGQCKWWSDKLGYGFVTIVAGEMKGKDIFVHHSGVRPLNSNYRTLKKGEYVNFDVTEGANGLQGVNITGICGGTLFCDVNPQIKPQTAPIEEQHSPVMLPYHPPPPPPPRTGFPGRGMSGMSGMSGMPIRGRGGRGMVPRAHFNARG